jgi:hypothetical protein
MIERDDEGLSLLPSEAADPDPVLAQLSAAAVSDALPPEAGRAAFPGSCLVGGKLLADGAVFWRICEALCVCALATPPISMIRSESCAAHDAWFGVARHGTSWGRVPYQ